MKICIRLFALLSFVTAVCSCDFVRTLAGRPTSADIEIKRQQIAQDQARKKAVQDSIDAVMAYQDKILATYVSIADSQIKLVKSEEIRSFDATALEQDFYIIAGAFSQSSNAQKLIDKAAADGFQGCVIKYRSGLNAVALCPSSDIVGCYESYVAICQKDYMPSDAWILEVVR